MSTAKWRKDNKEEIDLKSSAWRAENGERVRKYNRDRAATRRQWLYKIKNTPCFDCGQTFPPYVMQFDHRVGEEKLFNVGNGTMRNKEKLLAEIKKCDIVCANCHFIRTYTRRNIYVDLG